MGHCEQCGRLTEAHHHRGPKRFCSTSCARRYSVSCSRKMVAFHARASRGGRHTSANQLSSDRKSSYNMPMVSWLIFVDHDITHHPTNPKSLTTLPTQNQSLPRQPTREIAHHTNCLSRPTLQIMNNPSQALSKSLTTHSP